MSRHCFKVILTSGGDNNAWTILPVPLEVSKGLGNKGRVAVMGAINGFPFRSPIFPTGDGTHQMMVNKEMQKGAGVSLGDTVRVEMEIDSRAKTVEVPSDLQTAISQHSAAKQAFEGLAPSHRKEYVRWIEEAKKPETRSRRIEKTLEMLAGGQRRRS